MLAGAHVCHIDLFPVCRFVALPELMRRTAGVVLSSVYHYILVLATIYNNFLSSSLLFNMGCMCVSDMGSYMMLHSFICSAFQTEAAVGHKRMISCGHMLPASTLMLPNTDRIQIHGIDYMIGVSLLACLHYVFLLRCHCL